MDDDWFAVDDATSMNSTQRLFVDTVRPFARRWPECPPGQAIVIVYDEEEDVEEDGEVELRLIVDVNDLAHKYVLLTLGACLVGNTLLCTEVHNQTYLPQPSTHVAPVRATGTPQELAHIAAAWFEQALRRPVIAPLPAGPWSFASPTHPLPPNVRLARGRSDPSAARP